MSYTSDLKDELARFSPQNDCCTLAQLAAMARSMGELVLHGGERFSLLLTTEHEGCAKRVISCCRRLFQISPDIIIVKKRQPRPISLYTISLTGEHILNTLGMRPLHGIALSALTEQPCCTSAALRGMFLGCGMLSDPQKQYLMEFSLSSETSAEALVDLLARSGISCSWTERKDKEIVYIKEFESLVNLTGLMEGYSTLLELENIRVLKDVRNHINRRTNCDTANIDKTVNAAVQQIEDIKFIMQKVGLSYLSPPLEEAARLRMAMNDATLSQLAAELNISRSATNNRLRKIRQTAQELRSEGPLL